MQAKLGGNPKKTAKNKLDIAWSYENRQAYKFYNLEFNFSTKNAVEK